MKIFGDLWASLLLALSNLGAQCRFLLVLLWRTPQALLRFRLISDQIYNSGALSLVIIMLSGLFVGMRSEERRVGKECA